MKYHLDPEIAAFVEKSASAYPDNALELSMAEHRECYRALFEMFQAPIPAGVAKEDSAIPGRSGHSIPVRSYSVETDRPDALILYLHGGGFIVGNLDSHDSVCAEIAARTGIRVVAVDYRLAPEHLHPAQIEDTQDAFLALDRGSTIVAGDSAGGTLSAALCIAQQDTDRQPIGQLLIYPYLGGMHLNLEAHVDGFNAPSMTSSDIEDYIDIWSDGNPDWTDPTFAPLIHEKLSGLPPCIAMAAEYDPLRDDALVYADKLAAAGVKARAILDKGLPHGHLRARHLSEKARASFDRLCEALSELAEAGGS
ncbi:MAG: alpha/beta hydrolase [Gammaproteobacteria bacterium]|nr:alpha/beta hydrolase [Gammaproteobacteria bacterium]MYD75596.1 alpha/beta hydrolase [Gammaproteobacteria bacterium]MYJ53088.1 alpha/beta hydrolase [Gammaproteobacteria bacterium]